MTSSPNIKVRYEGAEYTSVSQFCKAVFNGVHETALQHKHEASMADLIRSRIRRGWSIRKVLFTPARQGDLDYEALIEKRKRDKQWTYYRGLECVWWPTCRKIQGWR